jgi:predicted phage-related endonuclease
LIIHSLIQGSDDWHKFRLEHFGASEAAAMLGISKKVKRTELLHMKHTGNSKEFSDWVQTNILEYGHEVEALTRPIMEGVIGDDLYPVTCSADLLPDWCNHQMSASCDGLTLSETRGWEHKQWNAELAAAVAAKDLPDEFMVQPQQCLMVTGASVWTFTVSDGTEENMVSMDILPDPAWFGRIRAGWEQFEKDLVKYQPRELAEKPQAEAIMQLPAVVINVTGSMSRCNLDDITPKFDAFITGAKTELKTDEDFANGEATAKFSRATAKTLKLKAEEVVGQISTISEAVQTLKLYADKFDALGLKLEKAVSSQKELIKAGILNTAKTKFTEHVAALEAEIKPIRLVYQQPDFAGAMKNKRTLASLHDAVDSELANAKIATDAIAKDCRTKLAWIKANAEGFGFLFTDLQQLIAKAEDDFQLVVNTRVKEHKDAEAKKEDEARERIRKEEEAKAHAKIEADRIQREAESRVATSAMTAISEARVAESMPGEMLDKLEIVTTGLIADMAISRASTASKVTPIGTPTLRLGQISDRLGFVVTADFLTSIGFPPAATDKSAKLYHESDFSRICAALMNHIQNVQQRQAA